MYPQPKMPRTSQIFSSLSALTLLALLLLAPAASARPKPSEEPESRTEQYSRYEQETIDLVAQQRGFKVASEPEGKIIESIHIVTLEVIEPRDPAPAILNRLHVISRDQVIRREVLQKEGEPFRKVLIDETARNLRRYSQLSLILCIATEGSTPDHVRILIITKDVWSLRLSWDVAFSSGGMERLVLAPTETNLLGYQHTTGLRLDLLPQSAAVSARYSIPRLLGTWIGTAAEVGLIFHRPDLETEGSFGSLILQRPLSSSRTPWGWQFSTNFRNEIQRRYVNAHLGTFSLPDAPESGIPFQYRSQQFISTIAGTRSFGWAWKNDLSAGVELLLRHFSVPHADRFDHRTLQEFLRARVPTTDNRLSPFLQWRSYTTSFLRTTNLDTLALQEDVRLGHDFGIRIYPAWSGLISSRTLLGVSASAGYTAPLSNGYARLSAASTNEFSISNSNQREISDGSFSINGRIMTPHLGFGRLLVDGSLLNRYRNHLNRSTFLGGDSRLRGWPSSFFVGKDLVVYNIEFRTKPVQILSCQLGGALFYDVGDAPSGLSHLDPKQSVGLGFRALFPQLDRVVFRGDLGFPLQRGGLPPGVQPVSFFLAFLQAFGDERLIYNCRSILWCAYTRCTASRKIRL